MKKLLTTIVCLILLMGTSMMNARPPHVYFNEYRSSLQTRKKRKRKLATDSERKTFHHAGRRTAQLFGLNHRIFELPVDSLKNTEPEHGARPHRLGTV